MKKIPFDLKAWLKDNNLTQQAFADHVGVDARTVRNWIRRGEIPIMLARVIDEVDG